MPVFPPATATARSWALAVTLLSAGACDRSGEQPGTHPGALDGEDFFLAPVVDTVGRVGAGATDEGYLVQVVSVAFDASGNLHALDADRHQVAIWNRRGEVLRIVGTHGEGPADFRRPVAAFVFRDGTLAVYDTSQRSFKFFDSEGRFRRGVRRSPGPVPGRAAVAVGDGLWVGPDEPWMTAGSSDEETTRPVFAYSFVEDTVRAEPFFDAWRPEPEPDGEFRGFGPMLRLGGLSDGRVALVDSVGYRVKVLSREGLVERILERPIDPFPVSAEAMEAERERRRAGMTERRILRTVADLPFRIRLSEADVSGLIGSYHADVAEMQFHAQIPVIYRLAVDWEDRIWVLRTDSTGGDQGLADLLTPNGEYLGTVRFEDLALPTAFGPDGLMAYVQTDELGVQTILVVKLISL